MTARLPFASADISALSGDSHPAVRRALVCAVREAFAAASPAELAAMLWELSDVHAPTLIPVVVPALAHPHVKVRRFALLALKSFHPLCALPARTGGGAPLGHDPAFMQDWLSPRPVFEQSLATLVQEEAVDRELLLDSLIALPGEVAAIHGVLKKHSGGALANRYLAGRRGAARVPVQLIVALTYRCDRKCPYCYAYESQAAVGHDMGFRAAVSKLDWAVRQRAELVSFTGGEPTLHPRFAELVGAVRKRSLKLYLNSNGLFGPTALAALQQDHVLNVGFHVSERKLHRRGELEKLRSNALALQAAGVTTFVRHTLWRSGLDDVKWLIAFCRELKVRHLNLALAFPGRSASNAFVDDEHLAALRPAYFRAMDLAARHGIRVRTSKPVPLCLFTPAQWAHFQRQHELASTCTVHERGGVHNLVVNPDGSTYPCVGLPLAGPALDEQEYGATRQHAQREIRRGLSLVQSGCATCAVYPTGTCQGRCLGHCHDGRVTGQRAEALVS